MRHTVIWLTWLGGATLLLPPSPPQTCTTVENHMLNRMETSCSDGTSAISRYDPLLDHWETVITRPLVVPSPPQPWKREHR